MKAILFGVFFSTVIVSFAQLPIGHRQMDFVDASRSRTITCEIYYPGSSAGEDVACATGTFPIIVFGHGYSMGYDSYLNFSDTLVPRGYIIVFPTTESGLSPDHGAFGLDLKFVNDELKSQALTNNSFFLFNHFNGHTALGGHSMGGGASFLAAAGNSNITTVITFAAAETDPSAIAAAANITIPVLIFQGENDGVAPPASHQMLMYNALTNSCHYKINILGGGHCYFAADNTACTTLEFFTSPQPTITRVEQQTAVFSTLIPYLHWQLKDDVDYKIDFEDSIQSVTHVNAVFSCNTASIKEAIFSINIFPNPAFREINIESNVQGDKTLSVLSIDGRKVISKSFSTASIQLNCEFLSEGVYILMVESSNNLISKKIVIQRNL